MNRIDSTFRRLGLQNKKALIGYITAGFPTKNQFLLIIRSMQKAGLDLIEIGVPFSDPVADGATVQRSSQKALENGVTLDWVLRNVRAVRPSVALPIIFMTYANPVLAMGLKSFFAKAQSAGVDGLIVPDLTPDEGSEFEAEARRHGLDLIYLVTPSTAPDRVRRIARSTQGFLYAVSLNGVTGARSALPANVSHFLGRLKKSVSKPVAVGFGISKPEQVRQIRKNVDGIIVGSALVNQLEKSVASAERFVASLQKALNPKP